MSSRVVLLHCHIFKNAGTTIDRILERNFGSGAVKRERDDGTFLQPEEICTISQANNKIFSISSHKMGLPVPKLKSITFVPLIMLRDPLDRLGSIYTYYKRYHRVISHECLLAKMTSFKEFVEITLSSGLDYGFSNLQAHFLLANNRDGFVVPSELAWPSIVSIINDTPCIGLVEKFDVSMVLWSKYLAQFFPNIDFSYSKKNVSAVRENSIENRLDMIRSELGPSLIDEFEKRNKFDYAIYELVQEKIKQEIGYCKGFGEDCESLCHEKVSQKIVFADELVNHQKPYQVRCWRKDGGMDYILLDKKGHRFSVPLLPKEMETVTKESVSIVGCGVFDNSAGSPIVVVQQGQEVNVAVVVEVRQDVIDPIVGITIEDAYQQIVFGMNSFSCKNGICSPKVGAREVYNFIFKMPRLNSGSYTISPAFASGSQEIHQTLSNVKNAGLFIISKMVEPRMPGQLYLKDYGLENFACKV